MGSCVYELHVFCGLCVCVCLCDACVVCEGVLCDVFRLCCVFVML